VLVKVGDDDDDDDDDNEGEPVLFPRSGEPKAAEGLE
jgi:hypothetical protein